MGRPVSLSSARCACRLVCSRLFLSSSLASFHLRLFAPGWSTFLRHMRSPIGTAWKWWFVRRGFPEVHGRLELYKNIFNRVLYIVIYTILRYADQKTCSSHSLPMLFCPARFQTISGVWEYPMCIGTHTGRRMHISQTLFTTRQSDARSLSTCTFSAINLVHGEESASDGRSMATHL
jgi:hypothetical protein